jgi:hypothetical protein
MSDFNSSEPLDEKWERLRKSGWEFTLKRFEKEKTIVTTYETDSLVDGVPRVMIQRELPESYLKNCSEEYIKTNVRRIEK